MAISKISSQAEARIAAEEEAAVRQRAARQAANVAVDQPPPTIVKVRVTKMGAGKVSMGVHVPGVGDAFYEKDEMPEFELSIAQSLEDRGYVEIQD